MNSDATEGALRFLPMRRPISEPESAASTPVESMPSDEELLFRIKNGNDSALGLLFERHARMVFAIGHRILRDRMEADEIVQDTFLYVREKAALFDPAKGTLKTWLVQVAYHRSLDRRVLLKKQSFRTGTNIDEIHDAKTSVADMERELGAKYDAQRLKTAFAELSERQRATMELFFFQGMTLREIAQRFDESLENVRHHYYRALGKLRRSSALDAVRKERDHES